MKISKHDTQFLINTLEQHRYGHTMTSMELAQKAGVPLDDVNRVERHLPLTDPNAAARIAKALGVPVEEMPKIAGLEDMTVEEFNALAGAP